MAKSEYKVVVYRNGQPVSNLELVRSHDEASPDKMTLSAHTIIGIFNDDVITVKLEPIDQKKYKVSATKARLHLKKEPWF